MHIIIGSKVLILENEHIDRHKVYFLVFILNELELIFKNNIIHTILFLNIYLIELIEAIALPIYNLVSTHSSENSRKESYTKKISHPIKTKKTL